MLIVIAEALLTPQQRVAFEALARPMIAASRAEAGCLGYWYAFDLLEPQRLRVNEFWKDRQALEVHFSTAHLIAFRKGLAALKPRELKISVRELGVESALPA